MRKYLVERYRQTLNEKYALQQYEDRFVDTFVSDMRSVVQAAPQIYLYLYKYGVFAIRRIINLESLQCVVNVVLYNKQIPYSEINAAASKATDIKISSGSGVDDCYGFAFDNTIVIWVPVNMYIGPYNNVKINKLISKESLNEAITEVDKNNTIFMNGFNKLDIPSLKDRNINAVKILNRDIPDNKLNGIKGYLDIDYTTKIGTLKHELTHILDNQTAQKINYYSSNNSAVAKVASRFVARKNNLDGDSYYETNKDNFSKLLWLLYRLWSYTEFNAFTQTYGRDRTRSIQQRSKDLDKIVKTSLKDMGRDYRDTLESFISTAERYIDELSECDLNFWETAKEITSAGCKSQDTLDRYDSMSPSQFKKYFINTSHKLVEKFKEKTFKNANTRNIYRRDVAAIAREIIDKCANIKIDKKGKSDTVVTLNFDFYFKHFNQNSPVTVTFTVPYQGSYSRTHYRLSDDSFVDIHAKYIDLNRHMSAREFFGKEHKNGFADLFVELYNKNRKTVMEELSLNFAEDLYKALSDLEP